MSYEPTVKGKVVKYFVFNVTDRNCMENFGCLASMERFNRSWNGLSLSRRTKIAKSIQLQTINRITKIDDKYFFYGKHSKNNGKVYYDYSEISKYDCVDFKIVGTEIIHSCLFCRVREQSRDIEMII